MRTGRFSIGAIALLAAATLPCGGCGLMPHAFRKLQPPPATERARSVGAFPGKTDSQVYPALVNRLDDEDPVVRMAAGDELRQRTGKDFGFVAWSSPEERAAAVARWRSWLKAPPMPAAPMNPPELPRLAAESSQPPRRLARRRRRRSQSPAPPVTSTSPITPTSAPTNPARNSS